MGLCSGHCSSPLKKEAELPERLYPYLSYEDAPRALEWLGALGFEVLRRQDGDDGRIVHSEVRLGDVVLMVASNDAAYRPAPLVGHSTGAGLYLLVESVDRVFSAAVEAGATSVLDPEQTEWGSRRARVLDPEGREWSFGTYEPGATW
jgi:uncharacterized glyoxalase superfamily protein PhnB